MITAETGLSGAGIATRRRVLYLVHDLDDAAVWRRVAMLEQAGAAVDLAGFRRGDGPLPRDAILLGKTRNARMAERAGSVVRARLRPHPAFDRLPRPDAILARNLETLALAGPLRRRFGPGPPIRLVYEVLDIHRLMVGEGRKARALRGLERRLCREIDGLLVSSPAFLRAHFERHAQCHAPATLVENKVLTDTPEVFAAAPALRDAGAPLAIGWFGILRCQLSLDLLDRLTRARPGRYRVVMRGRPALDALPRFHETVSANPDMTFGGAYAYPDDLARIYGEVDVAWLVDRYDAGANSDWLLPNRLYESGLSGVPPVGLAGTEIARRLDTLGIGIVIGNDTAEAAEQALGALSSDDLGALRARQALLPRDTFAAGPEECAGLLDAVAGPDRVTGPEPEAGVLIVIPALDEARHIGGVIDALVPALRRLATCGTARLVVADGGSRDGTQAIVRDRAAAHPDLEIHLIDNPGRLQSAAVNLASARYGAGLRWLVRVDAHAIYPEDYVETLLAEAGQVGADSVVVSMRAVGHTPMQRLIALTQNSAIGNGGSAHRRAGTGRFVDHGHHALMRRAAFEAVGGYDPNFSHNEDAELDLRLAGAGARIWLTAQTGLDYIPRDTLVALMRQYLRFGRGRARTVLKHRLRPRLRQMAMIGLAPGLALAVLMPVSAVFALPAALWILGCLGGGAALAVAHRTPRALAAGPVAGTMHLAWSAGFWQQLLFSGRLASRPAPAPQAPAVPPGRVAVGVCTFRRPGLVETLRTLEVQELPEGTTLAIVVADNDEEPSAEDVVADFAATSRHEVVYRHAPAGNISIARNAVLDTADHLAIDRLLFLDDDEIAPPNWAGALLAHLARDDADAVVGPVRAIYGASAPGWMIRRRVHDTMPETGPDGRPVAGHSCNVAIDLAAPAFAGRRFDLARGRSGGEDTAYFEGARRAGARLALASAAELHETVPEARARLDWLLKRRYRMGQTHGSLIADGAGAGDRLRALALACAKVCYCAAGALIGAPFAGIRNANLMRGALHAGTASVLLGLRRVTIYGATAPDRR